MARRARIPGQVTCREGDGVLIVVRPSPVEVQTSACDATLSGTDGETHGSAAMPIGAFRTCVAKGLIEIVPQASLPARRGG